MTTHAFDTNAPTLRGVAHCEVMAIPPRKGAEPPDGVVQLSWTDQSGLAHRTAVVKWLRLDRGHLTKGDIVNVDVQARQRRTMASPPHHVSAMLVLTGEPSDEAQVMIGDPDRRGVWAYGVIFYGAVLVSTKVLVAT